MRKMVLAVGAAVVVAATGGFAHAVPPDPRTEQAVELSGTNVLRGSDTGRVRVRVPRDASFLAGGSPEEFLSYVQVEGEGALVGYALVREDEDGQLVGDHIAGRFPEVDGIDKDLIGRSDCLGRTCVLEAGSYWLYLLTDGEPVSVTIRLDGLSGTTEIFSWESVPARFANVTEPSFDQGATPGVRSRALGATASLNAPGLIVGYAHGDWTTAFPAPLADEATVVVDNGLCTYQREPVEGYLPYCAASGSLAVRQLSSRQDSNGGYSQSGFFPRFTGTLGFGAYQTAVGQVDSFGLAGLWLQFEP